MHCTVQPGKYCTLYSPVRNRVTFPNRAEGSRAALRPVRLSLRTLHRSGSLGRENSEKVGGIVRLDNCGVKRKDTICSGSVAEMSECVHGKFESIPFRRNLRRGHVVGETPA